MSKKKLLKAPPADNCLAVTPSPFKTESPLGYILRLTEANGYHSFNNIFSLAGTRSHCFRSTNVDFNNLSSVVNGKDLEPLNYHNIFSSKRRCMKGIADNSKAIPNFWRIKYPQFCPVCIEENGFIESFWDLDIAVGCPKHRLSPIEFCSGCGKKISWTRNRLMYCSCGQYLGANGLKRSTNITTGVMCLIYAYLYKHDKDSIALKFSFPRLVWEDVELDQFLKILTVLARYDRFLEFGTAVAKKMYSYEVVERGGRVISKWPENYHEFLTRIIEKYKLLKPKENNLLELVRPFYNALFKWGGQGSSAEMFHIEFCKHAGNNWGRGTQPGFNKRYGFDLNEIRYLSITEVSRLLNISTTTATVWSELGKLKFKRYQHDNVNVKVYDRLMLPEPACSYSNIISCRKAASRIGIPRWLLKRLEEKGIYTHSVKPNCRHGYHIEDIRSFINYLIEDYKSVPESYAEKNDYTTLKSVLFDKVFWSRKSKLDFFMMMVSKEIHPVGIVGRDIRRIQFNTKCMARFQNEYLEFDTKDDIPLTRTLVLAGFPFRPGIGESLIRNQFLVLSRRYKFNVYVTQESAANFWRNFISLKAIASELKTSSTRLQRIGDLHKDVISIEYANGNSGRRCGFIRKSEVSTLIRLEKVNSLSKKI